MKNVIVGVPNGDCHVLGAVLLRHALTKAGFNVVYLGSSVTEEEFISAATETNAQAILISSLNGMARHEVASLKAKCIEHDLGHVRLYIGGMLGTEGEPWPEIESRYKTLGFDRVYPPDSPFEAAIKDLKTDLG